MTQLKDAAARWGFSNSHPSPLDILFQEKDGTFATKGVLRDGVFSLRVTLHDDPRHAPLIREALDLYKARISMPRSVDYTVFSSEKGGLPDTLVISARNSQDLEDWLACDQQYLGECLKKVKGINPVMSARLKGEQFAADCH